MPASEGVGDNPRAGGGGRLVGNGVEDGEADGEFGGRLVVDVPGKAGADGTNSGRLCLCRSCRRRGCGFFGKSGDGCKAQQMGVDGLENAGSPQFQEAFVR